MTGLLLLIKIYLCDDLVFNKGCVVYIFSRFILVSHNRLLGWVFFYFPIYSDLQKICIIKELFLLKNLI